MPYDTGTANSLGDLLTALRAFCVANGWTLSGNVLHKDGGAYTQITEISGAGWNDFGFLMITGGTGIDGSDNLTGASGTAGYVGPLANAGGASTFTDWDWPITYHVFAHEDPNEVYLYINYHVSFWQQLSFGQSPAPGCPGTGNWYYGFSPPGTSSPTTHPSVANPRLRNMDRVVANPTGSVLSSFEGGVVCPAPFFWFSKDESQSNDVAGRFHGCFDAAGATVWSDRRFVMGNSQTLVNRISAARAMRPLLEYSPNAWNQEAHLVRALILQDRPETKSSVIGELKHIRWIRNDFLEDGEVITLGPDKWKVFPMYRKNVDVRNGSGTAGANHSGTLAVAVRYDGP